MRGKGSVWRDCWHMTVRNTGSIDQQGNRLLLQTENETYAGLIAASVMVYMWYGNVKVNVSARSTANCHVFCLFHRLLWEIVSLPALSVLSKQTLGQFLEKIIISGTLKHKKYSGSWHVMLISFLDFRHFEKLALLYYTSCTYHHICLSCDCLTEV